MNVVTVVEEETQQEIWNAIDQKDLPSSMDELLDLIGFEKTMILLKIWAGKKLYISKKVKAEHRLIPLIGEVATTKLCGEYGGDYLRFPTARSARASARHAVIRLHHKEGETTGNLARKYKINPRYAAKIIEAAQKKN
ncbi:MAG: hypothetical protein KME06_09515 [Kastovskya adunca ATA6-11-RM4]|jgi:hypothetical protein|nr:hypothetical protein [Kastovskya adunca ATA6-11-RM4]